MRRREVMAFWAELKYEVLRVLKKNEREIITPPHYSMKPAQVIQRELGLESKLAVRLLELAEEDGLFRYVISQDAEGGVLWEFWIKPEKIFPDWQAASLEWDQGDLDPIFFAGMKI